MGERLRIGFLGAGLIATYHSKSLRRSGIPVHRVGVYDPDRQRAAAFAEASGHTAMDSEDAVLDSCDAVYICTWTGEHQRQVDEAARRGLAVFCEKPLAFDTTAAERMAKVVTEAGLVNQVGLVLRRSPAYLWAKHLIDDPAAGRVMAVVCRDDQYIPTQGQYASTWRANRTLAGAGTLLEHSIHDIDLFRVLVGEIDRVSAYTANFHRHDGIEDVAGATIRFAGGGLGTLTSVWHDNMARPSLRRFEILCERRQIVVDGDDWYGPVGWTDTNGDNHTLAGERLSSAVEPLRVDAENPDAAFVRAVLDRSPATPDFADAVRAHRVVDAMYESARRDGAAVPVGS
jgi:predicted dehydrogenase